MVRLHRVGVAVLTLVSLSNVPSAEADTIQVGGVLVGTHDIVTVDLQSRTRDFRLSGSAAPFAGVWGPDCFGDCLPGEEQSLTARFSGSDFGGAVSIDGHNYDVGLATSTTGEAGVRFEGSWMAPLFTGRTHATVVSPFTFEGYFNYPITPDQPAGETLVGSGVARLRLSWNAATDGWKLDTARYRFDASADPDPVPEPATMLLLATGLAGIAVRRRRPA